MKITNYMTKSPICCKNDSTLSEAARLMRDYSCGAILVVENHKSMILHGIITDRDVVLRAVATEANPMTTQVNEVMSSPAINLTEDADQELAKEVMARNKIRRIPIIDKDRRVIGIVAQADLARSVRESETAKVVREISH